MLTGAPVLESPARSLLLGERNSFGNQGGIAQPNFVIPHSLGASGGMGMSYVPSPRTDLGVSLEENRQVSRYLSSYSTSVTGSVGRKMGMHWFLRGQAGGSFSQVTQQTYGTPKTQQLIGGGSLGYKRYTHTFLPSYDRSSGDQYGFAVGASAMTVGGMELA